MRVVGIDEVGRGCLAGPLVAAAVVLDKRINMLRDSKLLSRAQRENIAKRIKQKALGYGIGWVSVEEINTIGLTKANQLAIRRALEQITCDYDQIIIDGSINYLKDNPKAVTLIKADQKVKCVSAASIIAKVTRDNHMIELANKFPHYQFDRHVGYGTKLHREMLKLHGHCELHRLNYKPLQELMANV